MSHPWDEGRAAFIGCGKMGEAMLAGWLSSDDASAAKLASRGFDVIVPDAARRESLESRYGVRTFASASDAPADASIIILAVKPQVMDDVVGELASSPAFADATPLVVSIAAGIPCARLEGALPVGTSVIRVMPNMPLQVQAGASVVAGGAYADQAEVSFVNDLFAALGTSQVVDEQQIDAVCALSGGGPAYFAYLAECLAAKAEEAGLSAELARSLARQTLAGTGVFLAKGTSTLSELRGSVCSPGGTTLAALAAMDSGGFAAAAGAGVDAAIERAKELSR